MKGLRHPRLVGTLILLPAAMLFGQQPPALTPGPPSAAAVEEGAKGQITGTVVSAKTGEILKGVSVTMRGMRPRGAGPGPPPTRNVTTGVDGRFLFADLPAGDYDLIASKAGYGGQTSFRPQARIRLGSSESRKDVIIRLQPSPVVTGRVLDAYGEPLPEAQVHALTRRSLGGRGSRWMIVGRAVTNDLGEYRLHSLDAGKHLLVALAPRATNPRGVGYAEFTPSFYQDAPSLQQATPLKLANGAELNGIDFRLDLSPETTVRGIVIDEATGEPCGDCNVLIGDEDIVGGLGFSVRPTEEGLFLIHGLRPGGHFIMARGPGRGPPRFFAEKVQVSGSGEIEVVLAIGGSQTVSGEVILEDPPESEPAPADQGQPASRRQGRIVLALESLGPFPYPGGRETVPPEGGNFELTGVTPGDYRIRVFGPGGGYLRSVSLGGRELEEPRITVPRGGPLSGLTLHIAFDAATVSGIVKLASSDESGEVRGEQAVVAAPESNPYTDPMLARVDPDGAFTLRGLAPGDYTLSVVPSPSVDVEDPELRRALKPYSKRISLAKNEQATVELTALPDSVELW